MRGSKKQLAVLATQPCEALRAEDEHFAHENELLAAREKHCACTVPLST
jgi:hypothetical protein